MTIRFGRKGGVTAKQATPEGIVKAEILNFLRASQVFHWVNQAGKVPGRKLLKVGIADILGIYKGRPLAIEVKSEKGKLTPEQVQFLEEFARHGGISMTARSVSDVEKVFSEVN